MFDRYTCAGYQLLGNIRGRLILGMSDIARRRGVQGVSENSRLEIDICGVYLVEPRHTSGIHKVVMRVGSSAPDRRLRPSTRRIWF